MRLFLAVYLLVLTGLDFVLGLPNGSLATFGGIVGAVLIVTILLDALVAHRERKV